ncbi:MAG: ATP-binding protein, partial [Oceanococcaceae bacterium]
MMRRLLRAALVAWFGYPGRALLIAASLSALVTAAGFTVLEWQARATTLQAETTRRLAEQWAADGQLRPAELVRDAHIVRAVQQQADGAITAMAEHTPLPPAWLPLRPLNWRAGPERLHLDLAPMNRAELREHAVGAIGTALPIALFVAMLLALWVQRPLTALQDWLLALDQGRLGQKPPPGPWPLHQITDELGVLAERLRHTRAALQERHNASERGHQATIRRLQQELARIHQEQEGLAAMGDSRGELLRTMSHEMRTPLTAIIGYADLLGRNDPSPEAGEYAGIISRSARNLLGMINNLLDLARIEAGALEPQSSEFDVSELIEDTVALLAPLAFDKRLELNTLIYHDVPPRLRGDALRIAQILTNLLSNAIKYTDAGEVIVRLMQERRDADVTLLRLEVEDTGRGLADDQKQKLFQAWRRFEVAGSKASGSGLGLAIVHKLLDVLDGDIQVQSTPGKGSLFIARVPCRRASATRGLMRWDALRGVRLWVCEPQATTARALSHLLTFWEVEFRFWSHPAELQDALEDPGSAVMADALLLGMDADNAHASALNDIMSLPAEQRPPTLVLVPSIDATTHQQWRDRGAQVVLAKGSPRAAL